MGRFSVVVEAALYASAARLHDPHLAYHNFSHAQRALQAGENLTARARAQGLVVDDDVVRTALLFHDAGYGDDPSTTGAPTREAYAAELAVDALCNVLEANELSTRAPFVVAVRSAILATHHGAAATSIEDQIVRRADLFELAADYHDFSWNTAALRTEAARAAGPSFDEEAWRASTAHLLGAYLAEAGTRARDAPDVLGSATFYRRLLSNLEAFLSTPLP